MRNQVKLILGDSLESLKSLPSDSVHTVLTSPPYWGLRDYGVDGQIGLEETFEEFLAKLVELFAQVKRVLHPTGTIWVNMGDSYNSAATRGSFGDQSKHGYVEHGYKRLQVAGLHSKNLVGQPWKLAFALQSDGWILRSDIIWHKPTAMPESVNDRPTRAHEFLFLLSKNPGYYYDDFAIREKVTGNTHSRGNGIGKKPVEQSSNGSKLNSSFISHIHGSNVSETRNKRTVWTVLSEPFPEAHFATYPTKLVEPCILAGTSEKGCCPKCYAPWARTYLRSKKKLDKGQRKRADAPGAEVSPTSVFRTGEITVKTPDGWKPSCKCDAGDPIPCTVLDPFSGAGTTGLVAARLQRSYIGLELNPEYLEMSRKRISDDQPLFNEVEVVGD